MLFERLQSQLTGQDTDCARSQSGLSHHAKTEDLHNHEKLSCKFRILPPPNVVKNGIKARIMRGICPRLHLLSIECSNSPQTTPENSYYYEEVIIPSLDSPAVISIERYPLVPIPSKYLVIHINLHCKVQEPLPRLKACPVLPRLTHMPYTATTLSHISYQNAVSDGPLGDVMVA